MATVMIERVETLPGGVAATYSMTGEDITVRVRDDLLTAEGARVFESLGEQILTEHWQPKTRLRLVSGGGQSNVN